MTLMMAAINFIRGALGQRQGGKNFHKSADLMDNFVLNRLV